MFKMIINGRLTEDAQVRSTKDGGSFLSLRVATNTYENGTQKPYFMSVAQFNYRPNMVQHLTKGSAVDITGTPQITAYVSKQGSPMPDISITADSVEFSSNGSSTNGGNNQTGNEQQKSAQNVQTDVEEEPVVTTTPVRKPKANTEKFDSNDDGGDLPF